MTENTQTDEDSGSQTGLYQQQPVQPNLKRFLLVRDEDETGISGTGIVAEGIQFANGWCCLSWLTRFSSIGVYPSVEELIDIHGHNGRTVVKWCGDTDPQAEIQRVENEARAQGMDTGQD